MEWSVPVNDMLHDDITKLNYTLIPPGFHGDVRAVRSMQESLCKVIDAMGEQSAAAQGLNRVITTAEKLCNAPTHTLYLYKDATAKNGQGEVIGFLKVGHKHLFLFDERNQVREVEPLCILDFYILHDRQRTGYGRALFDYMLHDMEVNAHELAIDGPSPKMEQFLAKNYGVHRLMRQNNNFAVAPEFFDHSDDISNKSGRSTPVAAASGAVGRFTAHKPPSSIGNVIHGGASYYNDTNSGRASYSHLFHLSHASDIWRSGCLTSGESWERTPSPAQWHAVAEAEAEARSARPASLRVAAPLPFADAASAGPACADAAAAGLPFGDVAAAGLPSGAASPAGARRDAQHTDKGYFDVKFYHNQLW